MGFGRAIADSRVLAMTRQPLTGVGGRLVELLVDGTLGPRPTEIVPLDAAPHAYARLAAGSVRALLVLAP